MSKGSTSRGGRKPDKPILKVQIRWSKRGGRVTSLTGGHVAQFEDFGDEMIITIFEERGGPRNLPAGGRRDER